MNLHAACPLDRAIYSPAAVEDMIRRSVRSCQWIRAPLIEVEHVSTCRLPCFVLTCKVYVGVTRDN